MSSWIYDGASKIWHEWEVKGWVIVRFCAELEGNQYEVTNDKEIAYLWLLADEHCWVKSSGSEPWKKVS